MFGLENAYDPTGPLPAEEDLFGLTNDLGGGGEGLDPSFNHSVKFQPQFDLYNNQPPHDLTTQQIHWGPSPVSSFSNSTAPTPINGDGFHRNYEEAERESKRRRESYDYNPQAPPPPPPAPVMSNDHSSPHHLNNGYARGTPGSGTNTPIGTLYSTSAYPNSSLDAVSQRTWPPNDQNGSWDERAPYFPSSSSSSSVDYGGGGMYVGSSIYGGGASGSGGMIGDQRTSNYPSNYPPTQSHQSSYAAPRLGAGRSSYIPSSNNNHHNQPPHYHSQPQSQHQPQSQSQPAAPSRSTPRVSSSASSIASLMPDTFSGPGGVPVPTPGQSQLEMIDAIGSAVDASVQSDGVAQCPYPNCNKTFAKNRTYNLKAHLRAHSQLKPFACTDCDRAFSRRHDLERHARVHVSKLVLIGSLTFEGMHSLSSDRILTFILRPFVLFPFFLSDW